MLKKRDIAALHTPKPWSFSNPKSKDYHVVTSSRDKMLKTWEVSNVSNSNFWLVNKVKDSWINSMNITPDGRS